MFAIHPLWGIVRHLHLLPAVRGYKLDFLRRSHSCSIILSTILPQVVLRRPIRRLSWNSVFHCNWLAASKFLVWNGIRPAWDAVNIAGTDFQMQSQYKKIIKGLQFVKLDTLRDYDRKQTATHGGRIAIKTRFPSNFCKPSLAKSKPPNKHKNLKYWWYTIKNRGGDMKQRTLAYVRVR